MSKRFDFPEPTKLLGGFGCTLTAQERNAWAEYVMAHPQWQEDLRSDAECIVVAAAIRGGETHRQDELRKLIAARQELDRKWYDIGKAWYAELAKDEKPEHAEV